MRYLALLFVLLVPLPAEGQAVSAQLVSFKKVAGPEITKTDIRSGMYIRAVRPSRMSDTLRVWIEHATPGSKPNYQSARTADIIVWCHPDIHPHPNHLFPDASGQIYFYQSERNIWLATQKLRSRGTRERKNR